jgi:hypothetical protein
MLCPASDRRFGQKPTSGPFLAQGQPVYLIEQLPGRNAEVPARQQ